MSAFIDEQRVRFGVEPICRILDVSASAFYQRASGERSQRAVEDERLLARIEELHAKNYSAYGYRKLWLALRRAGETAGRDRVKRLMRQAGIQGAKRRGKPWRTTTPDPAAPRSPDLVRRDFSATRPDQPWLADFTYLRCWQGVVFRDAGSYTSFAFQQVLDDHGVLASIGSVGDAPPRRFPPRNRLCSQQARTGRPLQGGPFGLPESLAKWTKLEGRHWGGPPSFSPLPLHLVASGFSLTRPSLAPMVGGLPPDARQGEP